MQGPLTSSLEGVGMAAGHSENDGQGKRKRRKPTGDRVGHELGILNGA